MLTKKQQILRDMPYEVLRFLCGHKNRTLLSHFVLNAMYGESTIFERMCRGTGRFASNVEEARKFYASANEGPIHRYWYCMDYFMYAFVWNHTTEGHFYWNQIYWKFWEYMNESTEQVLLNQNINGTRKITLPSQNWMNQNFRKNSVK